MEITHVIRGEDHLSNTASQAALYQGMNKKLPIFWHLPIIANTDGKKLSKRDFGFSLNDLRNTGYLPEAITNYLAILGASFKQDTATGSQSEIMSLQEIVSAFDFDHITSGGQIKYDIEKLRWINQKWIQKIPFDEFKNRIAPLFENKLTIQNTDLDPLLMAIKPELMTLHDVIEKTAFYFKAPLIDTNELPESEKALLPFFKDALSQAGNTITDPELFVKTVAAQAKTLSLPIKSVYALMRIALTGHAQGLGIKDLILLLGNQESYKRFSALISE
jgi:glutamyl/glutaminyl-tRNA synthetase